MIFGDVEESIMIDEDWLIPVNELANTGTF